MPNFDDTLAAGLIDQGCFCRIMQVDPDGDSGVMRVTTSDDRVYSIHFNPAE
jgi:hypothetical protein